MITTFHKGVLYEDQACKYLITLDFIVLCRRFKTIYGEIDIICVHDKEVHFIEVKFRKYNKEYSISDKQKQRIIDTAQLWLAENDTYANYVCMFDVMLFDADQMMWIKNAFVML